jgi:hypothetical protein
MKSVNDDVDYSGAKIILLQFEIVAPRLTCNVLWTELKQWIDTMNLLKKFVVLALSIFVIGLVEYVVFVFQKKKTFDSSFRRLVLICFSP